MHMVQRTNASSKNKRTDNDTDTDTDDDTGMSKKKKKQRARRIQATQASPQARMLIHRRCAHMLPARIRTTAKSEAVTGLHWTGAHEKCDCDTCMQMNAKKAPFKREATTRSTVPGERIHSDLKELPTPSHSGCKYAVAFIDDCTRRGTTYGLVKKDDALEAWKDYLENQVLARGYSVRYFRSDNGGEFTGELAAYNRVRGIQAERSPPHCQSGNGVAEVFWRDAFKLVRAILWDQQRDNKWWLTALQFATHIKNHFVTTALHGVPPEAAWTKKDIDMSHFTTHKVLGIRGEREQAKGTLDKIRIEATFIGYAHDSRSYLVHHTQPGTIYSRRYADVDFDERCKARDGATPENKMLDAIENQMEMQRIQKEIERLQPKT